MAKKSGKQLTEDEILRNAMSRAGGEGGPAAAAATQVIAPETPEPKIENEVREIATPRRRAPTPTVAHVEQPQPTAPTKRLAPGVHTITYRPLEDGDPFRTVFFGMHFEANLPRETSNVELVKIATTNPWFSVDGKPPAKRGQPVPVDEESMTYPGMTVEEAEKKEYDPLEHGDKAPGDLIEEIN